MLDQQEKNLLINAISIRLNRLQTILDLNNEDGAEDLLPDDNKPGVANEFNGVSSEDTLLKFARKEKTQLLDNLHWAQTDEAGKCQSCGGSIPIRRLLTIPTTRTCSNCSDSV